MAKERNINFQPYLQSLLAYDIQGDGRVFDVPTGLAGPQEPGLHLEPIATKVPKDRSIEVTYGKNELIPVLKGLRKYAASHVLLVGLPGSGKSTVLKQLLWEKAREVKDQDKQEIPVLVELRQYKTSILDSIRDSLQRHGLSLEAKEIEKLLFQGRLLILFDALNEAPTVAYQDLEDFQRKYRSTTPMIFTGRDAGWSPGDIENELEMLPPSESQIQQFVRAYLPEVAAEKMLLLLAEQSRSLAETPLLLRSLCSVFLAEEIIPPTQGLLWREFARSWSRTALAQKKGESEGKTEQKQWQEKSQKKLQESLVWEESLLRHLAFVMLRGDRKTEFCLTIAKEELGEILKKFILAKVENLEENPEETVAGCLRHWLESGLMEASRDCGLQFSHPALQEYYAAEYLGQQLASQSDRTLQCEYLNYCKWTQTLALLLGMVEQEEGAIRLVKLALEVDLGLGAKLAGAVQPKFQQQALNLILQLKTPQPIIVLLLEITKSPKAIQPLCQALTDEDWEIRSLAVEALGKISSDAAVSPLATALDYEAAYVRRSAADALGKIGSPKAASVLVAALEHEDPYVRRSAADALGEMAYPKAVEPLAAVLEHEDYYVRRSAADALGKIGSPKAISALGTALNHAASYVRRSAADALKEVSSQEVLSPLLAAVKNEDAYVRRKAVDALGELMTEAAVLPLAAALNYEDAYIRRSATNALGKIGSETAVSALVAGLEHEDLYVRSSAANALGQIGDEAAILPLMAALKDDNSDVRSRAANALGKIGDRSAVDPLIAVLSDRNADVRWIAANALGEIGGNVAVIALIKSLEDKDPYVRSRAANGLGKIGDNAAVKPLVTALRDEVSNVRWSAANALGKIGSDAAGKALVETLQDDDADVRSRAAHALGKIGTDEEISFLVAALKDEVPYVRKSAADALGEIGSDAAVRALIAALDREDSLLRKSAIDALGNIGTEAAIPPLVAALQDEDPEVRSCAADILGKISNSSSLSPAVVTALAATLQQDKDPEVRSYAASALGLIGTLESLPYLVEYLTHSGRIDLFPAIVRIQQRCGYYNCAIARESC
ncbi:MAG: NACHT domain-containing protein [Oscillatoria sp. SIO1A7]|nr:NACHT domain-containing protein [Oscillatoria sp. SIO1A7]